MFQKLRMLKLQILHAEPFLPARITATTLQIPPRLEQVTAVVDGLVESEVGAGVPVGLLGGGHEAYADYAEGEDARGVASGYFGAEGGA